MPASRAMSMAGWIGFTGNAFDYTLLSPALLAVGKEQTELKRVLSGKK